MASYAWARWLLGSGVKSEPIFAGRGTAAGAAPATFELVCYPLESLRRLRAFAGDVKVVTFFHVDDLHITVYDRSRRVVVFLSAKAAQASWEFFTKELGLPFAMEEQT